MFWKSGEGDEEKVKAIWILFWLDVEGGGKGVYKSDMLEEKRRND